MKLTVLRSSSEDTANDEPEQDPDETDVQKFLKVKFPTFYSLLSMNDEVWKELGKTQACTVFAPNAQAFENLGQKKLSQLEDPRNLETAEKMGAYHVVATEAVTYQRLRTEDWTKPKPEGENVRPLTVAGLVTLGGEVPVGRSKSGGFLGFGAKEDGEAVVGPNARVVQSFSVGDSFVHEVDDLISPQILWRYCDQLRIPGF